MASASGQITIQTVTLDPANWTLISPPAGVVLGTVTVRNQSAVDVQIRSDSADPATQDTIPANFERSFRFSERIQAKAGLIYAKPLSGTGPLVCVYNP